MVSQFKIECAVLVVLSPFLNGLQTTVRVLLRFLFLLFLLFLVIGQHFRFVMGQCHGDFFQSAAQFLNFVGRQRCFSADPLSAPLVEVNRGVILNGFVSEYWQRLERWPCTRQDRFHLGSLQWKGESSSVALSQSHDSAQSNFTSNRTLQDFTVGDDSGVLSAPALQTPRVPNASRAICRPFLSCPFLK